MFFDSWSDLGRLLIVGPLAYAGLLVLLRITGKRTLSKLNAFDLVVTVALGSTLSTILLSKDVALLEGLAAFAVLCILQFVVATGSVHWSTVERWVKAEPCLVFHQGRFLRKAMNRERLTEAEVVAAMRGSGAASSEDVQAVVLETDGSLSVMSAVDGSEAANLLPETGAGA